MTAELPQPIEIFYSYAHKDEKLRNELEKHLYHLKRKGLITNWYDRDISAGTDWEYEIDTHLNTAGIILLLISPDFIASDYCYSNEMTQALQRHETGNARVIPIILRPTDYKDMPFSKLHALPTNTKPVMRWTNRDEAFLDVARGIQKAIKELQPVVSPSSSSSVTSISEVLATSTVDLLLPTMKQEEQSQLSEMEPVWYVPYKPNPFFTGRKEYLNDLRKSFTSNTTKNMPMLKILSGLGGIGKTQIAIEYAYRYRDHYHTVLWAKADSLEVFTSEFVHFADLLNLPGKHEQDQKYTIAIVKRWLEKNTSWLLILDNVEDLNMANEYLPSTSDGHILLTTRTQVLGGMAPRYGIEKMTPEEGALLLLRRANLIHQDSSLDDVSSNYRMSAIAISELLDGLPLAIDQAAAYLEETGANLTGFIDLYEKRRTNLLKVRGGLVPDHPEPVSTTWSLSFERVEQANPAAAELLRFFAFLHADAIPDELIITGAPYLGSLLQPVAADPYELNQAIRELLKYSLVRRNPEGTSLSLHRLVQTVLKDTMDEQRQQLWAERTIRAINAIFPKAQYATWQNCLQYLPHAQLSLGLMKRYGIVFPEAARLLNEVGHFLVEFGQYPEAAPFLEQALSIREYEQGVHHLDVAESLNELAELFRHQGKYTEATPLLERALAIREETLGTTHPDVAIILNNLARPYHHLYQFSKAETLYQRALTIREQVLGPTHPDVADTLNDLGSLYQLQGLYEQARPLAERALAIRKQVLGPMHPDTAKSIGNLGKLYQMRGLYEQAKPLLERALSINEQVLGPRHPDTVDDLMNLASFYHSKKDYSHAEPFYIQALKIDEQSFGTESLITVKAWKQYIKFLRDANKRTKAIEMEERLKAAQMKHVQEERTYSESTKSILFNTNGPASAGESHMTKMSAQTIASSTQLFESGQLAYRTEDQPWFIPSFPQTKEIDQEQIKVLSDEIDVVIITATDVELRAVMRVLEPYPRRKSILRAFVGPETYYLGKFGEQKAVVTKCRMGAIGEGSVILATTQAQTVWHPKAIIMVGIAFGKDPVKQKIGDVLVAAQIISYEQQRVGEQVTFRGAIPPSNTTLLNRFENAPMWHFPRPDGKKCELLVGPILSGEKLIDEPEFKARLFEQFPQAIGGEMEGAGLCAASGRVGVAWILIKSICDWGDGNKHNQHQALAAAAATSLVHHVLSQRTVLDSIDKK